MRKHTDYIYRTVLDSRRIRIERHEGTNQWNVTSFDRNGDYFSFAAENGDLFFTKRSAKEWAVEEWGTLISINPGDDMLAGWD